MKIYAHYDFKDFLIALGYKGEHIKKYIVDYCSLTNNKTVNMQNGQIKRHDCSDLDWTVQLIDTGESDAKTAIWGAGSKGITLLNVLQGAAAIDFVIDINPHKQGLYVPGTAQQVVSPDRLHDIRPDVIIVMNPLYLNEIEQMITALNLPNDKEARLMPVGH